MRAAAEVDPVALAVEADFFLGRDAGDDLRLVVLADPLEERDRVVALHHATRDRLVGLREFAHALLDRDEVLGRERPREGKVVIKAIGDHGADRDLRLGEELLDGLRQQVSRRVAQDLEAIGILRRDDRNLRVAIHEEARIDELAVDPAAERRLAQARADAAGDFIDGEGLVVAALTAIRQRDDGHAGRSMICAGLAAIRVWNRFEPRALDVPPALDAQAVLATLQAPQGLVDPIDFGAGGRLDAAQHLVVLPLGGLLRKVLAHGLAAMRGIVARAIGTRDQLLAALLQGFLDTGGTNHRLDSSRRCGKLVGASGIEPPTTSMSRKCSTTELRAYGGAKDNLLPAPQATECTAFQGLTDRPG